jgi:hypothetical protein
MVDNAHEKLKSVKRYRNIRATSMEQGFLQYLIATFHLKNVMPSRTLTVHKSAHQVLSSRPSFTAFPRIILIFSSQLCLQT